MKISVLGCGRWGSCIAWYLDRIGHEVVSCGLQNAPELQQLLKTHHNDYLTYPESITVTYDHQFAIERAEVIVISISAQCLRDYMQTITEYDLDGKIIVLCMKGIEESTGKRLTQVVSDFVDTDKTPVAVWVGPGHPQDYVKGIPNCMVIDSENEEVKDKLVHSFNSELIRFYLGTDLIGSEIGAAAKNVVGIAAGMLDGAGCTSIKGALMARGTREVARLIKAAGGNELSAYGLCHLGDYEATREIREARRGRDDQQGDGQARRTAGRRPADHERRLSYPLREQQRERRALRPLHPIDQRGVLILYWNDMILIQHNNGCLKNASDSRCFLIYCNDFGTSDMRVAAPYKVRVCLRITLSQRQSNYRLLRSGKLLAQLVDLGLFYITDIVPALVGHLRVDLVLHGQGVVERGVERAEVSSSSRFCIRFLSSIVVPPYSSE